LFNKAIVYCARANTQLFWPFIFILSGANQYSVFSVFTDEIFDGCFSTKVAIGHIWPSRNTIVATIKPNADFSPLLNNGKSIGFTKFLQQYHTLMA
jgi:hypothetical protein